MCVANALVLCVIHFSFQCSCLHCLSAFCGIYLPCVLSVGPREASLRQCAHHGTWEQESSVSKICQIPQITGSCGLHTAGG